MLQSSFQPQRPDRLTTPASTHDNSVHSAEDAVSVPSRLINSLSVAVELRLPAAALDLPSSRANSCNLLEATGNPIVRCALCRRRHRQMKQASFEVPAQASHDRGASLVFQRRSSGDPGSRITMRSGNEHRGTANMLREGFISFEKAHTDLHIARKRNADREPYRLASQTDCCNSPQPRQLSATELYPNESRGSSGTCPC